MCRGVAPEGKRNNESHADEVVRHAGEEIQSVAREIDHLADVLDFPKSWVERPHMNGQRNLQPFSPARVCWRVLRENCCDLRVCERGSHRHRGGIRHSRNLIGRNRRQL